MGAEIAALFGLTSAFAVVGAILASWMAWRIVEKTGLPGWVGLGTVLLTLTAVASIVPLILLWVFAYMRWPRDEPARTGPAATLPSAGPARSSPPGALPAPPMGLADRRGWRLTGRLAGSSAVALAIDEAAAGYLITGAATTRPDALSVPDSSVGQPHARLLIAAGRLGLEDLGTAGGTFIDGARLLPEHGPRDISAARSIRLGNVELALSRA